MNLFVPLGPTLKGKYYFFFLKYILSTFFHKIFCQIMHFNVSMSFNLRIISNSFLKNQCLIDHKIIFLHFKHARRFSPIFGCFRESVW